MRPAARRDVHAPLRRADVLAVTRQGPSTSCAPGVRSDFRPARAGQWPRDAHDRRAIVEGCLSTAMDSAVVEQMRKGSTYAVLELLESLMRDDVRSAACVSER